MSTVSACIEFAQNSHGSSVTPLKLLAQVASAQCPLSEEPVISSLHFINSDLTVVSDCSTHLIFNSFLEKFSSSTSENEATSNLECGITKVASIFNSDISQDVHYSKPIFVNSLPLKETNSQQSSNVLPLIVDVNIETPQVCLSVDLHSCQHFLSLTSCSNALNTTPNNFEVSVSET